MEKVYEQYMKQPYQLPEDSSSFSSPEFSLDHPEIILSCDDVIPPVDASTPKDKMKQRNDYIPDFDMCWNLSAQPTPKYLM